MEVALSLIIALIILRYVFRGIMGIIQGLANWLARAFASNDPAWRAVVEANIEQEEATRKASRMSWVAYILRSLGMLFVVLVFSILFIMAIANAP